MPSLRRTEMEARFGMGYTEKALAFMPWIGAHDRAPAKVNDSSKAPPLKFTYHEEGSSALDSELRYVQPYTRLDCLDGKGLARPCNV